MPLKKKSRESTTQNSLLIYSLFVLFFALVIVSDSFSDIHIYKIWNVETVLCARVYMFRWGDEFVRRLLLHFSGLGRTDCVKWMGITNSFFLFFLVWYLTQSVVYKSFWNGTVLQLLSYLPRNFHIIWALITKFTFCLYGNVSMRNTEFYLNLHCSNC